MVVGCIWVYAFMTIVTPFFPYSYIITRQNANYLLFHVFNDILEINVQLREQLVC